IASDGSLGSWNTGSALNTARYLHGVEIWNGYIYAIGGCSSISSGSCASRTNSVEYAPLYSDGSLGVWRQTDTLNTARDTHSTAVYGGHIYVLGGCSAGNCSTDLDSIEYTSINSAGSLADGSWSSGTSMSSA